MEFIWYTKSHIFIIYRNILGTAVTTTLPTFSVLRSERVQQRHEANTARQLEDIEKLYSQVARDIDEERQREQQSDGRKSSRLAAAAAARVSELTDASQLFERLRVAIDPQAIEAQLSATQKHDLMAYQAQQTDKRNDLISRRIRERLAGNTAIGGGTDGAARPTVTPLLKLRVIDASRSRSGDEHPKAAMLSVWNPAEHLLEMLREQQMVDVCNASASGIRYGDLQLSAGRGSQFRTVPATAGLPAASGMERHFTPISDIYPTRPQSPFRPLFNEFDTVGIVVRISETSTRKFQSVYVAVPAPKMPAVLCINFWAGLHAFAYDTLVVMGRALAARDLQWRPISGQSSIPCSFATEFTLLTEQPRQPALAEAMATLRQSMDAQTGWSLDRFVGECARIIDASSGSRSSASSSANRRTDKTTVQSPQTPLRSGSNATERSIASMAKTPKEFSPGTGNPVSMVQKRIEQLARAYGEPPPLKVMQTGLTTRQADELFKRPRNEN